MNNEESGQAIREIWARTRIFGRTWSWIKLDANLDQEDFYERNNKNTLEKILCNNMNLVLALLCNENFSIFVDEENRKFE